MFDNPQTKKANEMTAIQLLQENYISRGQFDTKSKSIPWELMGLWVSLVAIYDFHHNCIIPRKYDLLEICGGNVIHFGWDLGLWKKNWLLRSCIFLTRLYICYNKQKWKCFTNWFRIKLQCEQKKKKKKERNLDNRVEQVDSNGQTNAVEDSQAKPPPNKIECFQLNVESNNKWAPDLDLAEYANTFIQNFAPTQTFKESTLDKNQVPTNIKEENLLDQYLLEQSKCIPLSQDK